MNQNMIAITKGTTAPPIRLEPHCDPRQQCSTQSYFAAERERHLAFIAVDCLPKCDRSCDDLDSHAVEQVAKNSEFLKRAPQMRMLLVYATYLSLRRAAFP